MGPHASTSNRMELYRKKSAYQQAKAFLESQPNGASKYRAAIEAFTKMIAQIEQTLIPKRGPL